MAWPACPATFPCHPVPPQHTHTHIGGSAIWHRVILIFWVHPGGLWGQELGRVAQVAQSCGLGVEKPKYYHANVELWSVPVAILVDVSAILMWAVGQQ